VFGILEEKILEEGAKEEGQREKRAAVANARHHFLRHAP
jgi:hypothetical protein